RVCFRHAEELGVIVAGSNPASKVPARPGGKGERFLTPAERKALVAALARAARIGPWMKGQPRGTKGGLSPGYVRLFRLLILTGCRLSEIRLVRWENVDWHHRVLHLDQSKTGPAKDVPLTKQAIAFLKKERGPT